MIAENGGALLQAGNSNLEALGQTIDWFVYFHYATRLLPTRCSARRTIYMHFNASPNLLRSELGQQWRRIGHRRQASPRQTCTQKGQSMPEIALPAPTKTSPQPVSIELVLEDIHQRRDTKDQSLPEVPPIPQTAGLTTADLVQNHRGRKPGLQKRRLNIKKRSGKKGTRKARLNINYVQEKHA